MATRILVRPFNAADMDRILQIEGACFGKDAYDRKLFAELFHICGDLFLTAVHGRKICGYMVTCKRGRSRHDAFELVSLAVDPAFRGRGAASSLMKNTLRTLRLRGAVRISLMVRVTNETARQFYAKSGFRRVRKVPGYYEDGEDGILMSRNLR